MTKQQQAQHTQAAVRHTPLEAEFLAVLKAAMPTLAADAVKPRGKNLLPKFKAEDLYNRARDALAKAEGR